MSGTDERREALRAVCEEAMTCVRCPQLAVTRTQVVFGSGHPDADVLFLGDAPGRDEDEAGEPLVGRAGALLDELLAGIGLARHDVFVAHALSCRPPQNRDPAPSELANCAGWLHRRVELIRPVVVCTLGNLATKLLRADPAPIARIHGQAEVAEIGTVAVRLLPLFHPAAALYDAALVDALRADIAQIPALVALGPPAPPVPEGADLPPPPGAEQMPGQLGLF